MGEFFNFLCFIWKIILWCNFFTYDILFVVFIWLFFNVFRCQKGSCLYFNNCILYIYFILLSFYFSNYLESLYPVKCSWWIIMNFFSCILMLNDLKGTKIEFIYFEYDIIYNFVEFLVILCLENRDLLITFGDILFIVSSSANR